MNDKPTESALPVWLLPVFSWTISLYFCIDLVHEIGILPDGLNLIGHAPVVILFLFFLFLPFFTKIKIGKLLELEREVKNTKEEVKDFKSEVRNSLSVISTNVNTIGGFSNQFTVNLPNMNELRGVRKEIENNSPRMEKDEKQDDLEQVLLREDPALALAWTRIEIERLLRTFIGRDLNSWYAQGKADVKFASLPQLFEAFVKKYPEYQYLRDAFSYVTQVCNAAIHAQFVPDDKAREALGLGGQVIVILRHLIGEGAGATQDAHGAMNEK
jgi:hypothetical protein